MCVQDAEVLRGEVSRWESQARQREMRLAGLEKDLLEKTYRVETLHRHLEESNRQLGETKRQLDESKRQRGEVEQWLELRLNDCEEELARQSAMPPLVKVRRHAQPGTMTSYRTEITILSFFPLPTIM